MCKADPEEIQRLIDHDRYFPAYHMDKVHWISILLDKETDMDAASGCWMRVMLSWRSPAGRATGKSRNKGRGNL